MPTPSDRCGERFGASPVAGPERTLDEVDPRGREGRRRAPGAATVCSAQKRWRKFTLARGEMLRVVADRKRMPACNGNDDAQAEIAGFLDDEMRNHRTLAGLARSTSE